MVGKAGGNTGPGGTQAPSLTDPTTDSRRLGGLLSQIPLLPRLASTGLNGF